MAISKTSGALALTEIQTEFGGSNPVGMSEYYGDGDYVPDGTTDGDDNAIPESGAISVSHFYDTSNATYIATSGGSEATSGDYRLVTFTSSGTLGFTAASGGPSNTVDYLIVAGGGNGGPPYGGCGGGGAGGMKTGTVSPSDADYTITIGGGGGNNSSALGLSLIHI